MTKPCKILHQEETSSQNKELLYSNKTSGWDPHELMEPIFKITGSRSIQPIGGNVIERKC